MTSRLRFRRSVTKLLTMHLHGIVSCMTAVQALGYTERLKILVPPKKIHVKFLFNRMQKTAQSNTKILLNYIDKSCSIAYDVN